MEEKKEKTTGSRPKRLSGKIVSDKMKDTVVVEVQRFVKYPKYGKYRKIRKKYKVHDPENRHKIGDEVVIEECRPISKDKHFVVIQ